jgi:hypothetical protein
MAKPAIDLALSRIWLLVAYTHCAGALTEAEARKTTALSTLNRHEANYSNE